MTVLGTIVAEGRRVPRHEPWPRVIAGTQSWGRATEALAAGRLSLLGLWGEPQAVHMALLDAQSGEAATVSLECPRGTFPSVGKLHAPAIRLERGIRDVYGLVPDGALDTRPWLDHGAWDRTAPLSANPGRRTAPAEYMFLTAEGEDLHQIAVGPVHAGIIEPGHFRFTANGEAVVRLEERFGYVHKGIEGLLKRASMDRAAQLAGRISGDSTVAYQFAFARAVDSALGIEAPPRAKMLCGVMAELERLANHLGDIGAICNDAAFSILLAHFGVLRETVLRAADAAFGHRLMRDVIVPGGISRDIDAAGADAIRHALAEVGRVLPRLVDTYDNTASLQDRTVGTGIVSAELAGRFAAGGFVGRASGRTFDARKAFPYPPYDALDFEVPVLAAGDVNARVWVRIREVEQSLALVAAMLDALPGGPLRVERPPLSGQPEGIALIEGFRGDVLCALRLGPARRIEHCHFRDPSWFQWPLLEAAIEGNIVADFPLCNKSFNCSYSGVDL